MEKCPCSSGKSYKDCCKKYIIDEVIPETPEALMRSRYTAYTLKNIEYIMKTMRGPAAMDFDKESTLQWANQIIWLGLKVIRSLHDETEGLVEYIASYSYNGNKDIIYEKSEFLKENGTWFYIDGEIPKIGRNDTCPCGSQKKFKKCCG